MSKSSSGESYYIPCANFCGFSSSGEIKNPDLMYCIIFFKVMSFPDECHVFEILMKKVMSFYMFFCFIFTHETLPMGFYFK